jgi:hypothetical protein
MRLKTLTLALLGPLAVAGAANACTTILLGEPGHTRLAFSYDFVTEAGAVLVNGRGAERRSIFAPAPAVWTVDHASVTFNQFGPGLPTTGMNDAGLVVTLMWNEGVAYPAPTGAPGVGELELIQRLLDTSATVAEAVAEARATHVPGMVPIHYFVTDPTGARAILAHEHGDLTVRSGDAVPIPALTNIWYAQLLDLLPTVDDERTGGADSFGDLAGNSVGRFADAASSIAEAGATPSTGIAFEALGGVANEMTQWNVVYTPAERIVAFRLGTDGPVQTLDLVSVDHACHAHPLGLRLGTDADEDMADNLAPFDEAAALSLIEDVYPGFPPTAAMLPPEEYSGFAAEALAATECLPDAQ